MRGERGAEAAITAVGLRKRYGDTDAVAGVDLVVAPGELVAVLGPNGAGKTTTIEMLLGLRRPTAGTARVFGLPPESRVARSRVGAMLQDTDAPPGWTVEEMVGLVGSYYPRPLPVREVLERADLAGQRRARAATLSGGQRQRLSFALAVVGDPDLLFLDEPTAALDVEARRLFWQQVRGLADRGRTVLFSTHNLAEADAVAERVVVVHRGRVAHDGTAAAVKALVGGRTVRFVTDAPPDEVRAAGADTVELDPAAGSPPGTTRVLARSAAPERLVTGLVTAGRRVDDLTVTDTDLETAFLRLTGPPGGDPARAPSPRLALGHGDEERVA